MKTKKTLDRRDFIMMTVAGSGVLFMQGCQDPGTNQNTKNLEPTPAPPKIRTRYSITSPHEAAKRNVEYYKKAVAEMKKISKNQPDNKMGWIAQAAIHYENCGGGVNNVHNTGVFLPWHRAYLIYFEEICRKILSDLGVPDFDDFALPYWDWPGTNHIPEVFRDQVNDKWDDDLCNVEPPKEWNLSDADRKDWERRKDWQTACPDLNQSLVDALWKKDFNSIIGLLPSGKPYIGEIQNIHNTVHIYVKGTMAHSPTAALDPLFWLHHSNVDRIWDQWMKKHEKELPSKCPATAGDCCHNCASINDERDKKSCLQQVSRLCQWLGTEITGIPPAFENTGQKQICSLFNTLNLNYKYDDSEEIHFGDCLNTSTVDKEKYSIGKDYADEKIADINNPVKISSAEFIEQPKDGQILEDMVKVLSQLSAVKTASNSPSDTPSSLPALLLTVEIKKPEDPSVSVRVFIDLPDNLSEPFIDIPYYAATISFFESGEEAHHEGMMMDDSRRFILDITETIMKIETFNLADAKISIFPKFLNGEPDGSLGRINISSLRLLIAQ